MLLTLSAILCGCAAASSSPASPSVLYRDDFSSAASGWDRLLTAEGVMDYDGGGYRMLVNTLQANFWSTPHRSFTNVRLEVDAGKLAGPDENRIGLICRYTGEDYYFLIITSDGYYAIGIFTGGRAALLGQSAMQYSAHIKTGLAVNHLRADCSGQVLALYANGALLGKATDPSLKQGGVGLLAGTFSEPGVDVIFDDFQVLKP